LPSQTYELVALAIAERTQVLCLYRGYPRALCPAILGHTKGREYTLAYQFAGESSSGLPSEGQWKCLRVAEMRDVELRRGKWYSGTQHRERQTCVEVVDLDVNPRSPYRPRRSIPKRSKGQDIPQPETALTGDDRIYII
jgi:hypothetical protein